MTSRAAAGRPDGAGAGAPASSSRWRDDLALALRLADLADAVTMRRWRAADLVVEAKADTTPVTDADREVEQVVRAEVARARPGDAVLGEEYGDTGGSADGGTGEGSRRWVVDPVDGTKNFVRSVPVWATLVALEETGDAGPEVVVGVVSAPALGRRWWASSGGGAWAAELGGPPRRLAVSRVGALADASLSYSSLTGWEASGRLPGLLALTREVWRTRAFGDFWSHVLVAEGAVDVSAEPEVSLWDLAALQVVVEEAGGTFTDLGGTRGARGGSVVASNGLLHADVLRLLSPSEARPLPGS